MIVIIMAVTDEGQISIDFLLGINVFLLTLGFVILFIPSLFISTPGGVSLNSVAYRTANILVDDPGWWQNNTQNGTDWETHTGNISRIGLASDATPSTRRTRTPKMLNKTKILRVLELNTSTNSTNRTMLTTRLGLFDIVSGYRVDYGYNITVLGQDSNPVIINSSINGSINSYIVSFGETPPASQDRYKITRNVLVDIGNIASFRFDELTNEPLTNGSALINISGPQNESVIIQITGFNVTGNDSQFNGANLKNGSGLSNLSIPSNYSAYKRTNTSDFVIYSDPLNRTDTLRLIYNRALFPINNTYQLELNFTRMNFTRTGPPYVNYTDRIEPLYEPATLVVEVWT